MTARKRRFDCANGRNNDSLPPQIEGGSSRCSARVALPIASRERTKVPVDVTCVDGGEIITRH